MAGITLRINELRKQGISSSSYIKISAFEKQRFDDGISADDLYQYDYINISPSMIGDVTEYMTALMLLGKRKKVFAVPLEGARIGHREIIAKYLLRDIQGLNRASIESACKLLTFTKYFFYAHPIFADLFGSYYRDIVLQKETADNIRIFVNRSVEFFGRHMPVIRARYAFPLGSPAYGSGVSGAIIDFLAGDTLWDMKVQKGNLKSDDALQVLAYWIMGQHSGQEIFKGITKIGLYNPRQNVAYTLEVAKIPASVIREVEEKVICY